MATRESVLVFKDQGAEGVTGRVIHLAEALDRQKRSADQLAPVLKKTTVDTQAFGSIAQSSSAKITSLTNSLGPLGAGLGSVSRAAPQAAMGLLQLVVAQEKASLLQRSLNVALMGGTAAMLTGAVTAAAYADDALRAADTYASLQARIRTFSEGNIEAARTERELYAAARESRTGVVDLTTLYTRLTPAVEDYGRSQKDALAITQLTSKALAIQGADIREQAAATVQFSQSIASGVMRGDELRSLLESSPQLLRYIAQNLEINGKVGVAFSSLRKLGEEGALTTERIIDALLRAQPAIEKDFINAPKTAQQGWVILKDEIIRTVGSIDKTLGGQQAVVKWLNEMATKAEAWRSAMLLDPTAMDPVREAAAFIGDAAGSIGALGKVAVDNFDLIVDAGQAIIALKLGSVMASWFAAAATGAQSVIGKIEAFKAAAQVQAATTAMPNEVKAAQALRAAATAADLRATEKAEAAAIAKAKADAIRTTATDASTKAEALRTAETLASTRAEETLATVERQTSREVAAAQRLKGEAAQIRAVLEEDAARRIVASNQASNAAAASRGLSQAGIGTAGTYYAGLAQQDARAAAMLTDVQRQQQLARLREIEIAESRAANTVETAEARKSAAVVAADREMAAASTLAVQRKVAETEASALLAAAVRAETQADAADTAATTASGVATTRNTIAKTAEAAVTIELTAGQMALNAAKTVGLGLYNLLGGAVGLATLALGGLIYAVWKAHEAEKARYEAMRQSVDITDRLKAATDAMAAATWAEIPGILAKNKALRDQAAAQREVQAGQLKDKQAQLADLNTRMQNPLSDDEYQMMLRQKASLEREIKARGGNAEAGLRSAAAERDQAYQDRLIAAAKEKGDAQSQISRGTDDAGRPLSAARTEELKAVVDQKTAYLRAQVDKLTADIAIVDAKSATASKDEKLGLGSLRANLGSMKDIASEGVLSGALTTKPPPPTPKAKAISVPGGVTAAYDDLLKAGFLNLTGGKGYAAGNGGVTLNGSEVVARSDDEATALTKYVKVVEALNDATDAQLAKRAEQLGVSVRSRAEMKAAAGAILEREMATSKAAQADDRWADIQAQMEGKSRAEITALRTINSLRQDGTAISEKAADAYVAWVVAKQKIDDLQKGMGVAQPLVQRGFDLALGGKPSPVDSRGVLDEVKATEQLMAAKAAVILDRDRAVNAEIQRKLKANQIAETDLAKETANAIAAYDIAVEIATQDQLLEIRKASLKENLQAQEQQIAETSDAIVGALREATMGGNLKDIGKRLGSEMLSALYDEILFSPMRLMIQGAIRSLMQSQGGGSRGMFGTLINAGLGMLGRANLESTVSATIASNPNLFYAGRVPGYADGRVQASQIQNLIFRGRGGPRGDDNLVRISDGEAIINAEATSMSARILHLVNTGKINDTVMGFANGRVPGGSLSPGPVVSYAPRREGDVILNNMTGMAATATRRTDERGNTHIDLKPLADQFARQAGQSGALRRGLQQSPQPTKRA